MWKCFWLGGDLAVNKKEEEEERKKEEWQKWPLHKDEGAGTKPITLHFCHIHHASSHTVEKQQGREL